MSKEQEMMNKMIGSATVRFSPQPTKIVFEQLFPTGVYQNQRLSIEYIVGDEDPVSVFERAKQVVNDAFEKMNPQIKWDETNAQQGLQGTEVHPVEETPKDKIQAFIETINYCTNATMLERFKAQVDREKNDKLTEAYNQKLKQLQ